MALYPYQAQRIAQKSRAARAVRTPAVTPQQDKDNAKVAQAIMYARKLKREGRAY